MACLRVEIILGVGRGVMELISGHVRGGQKGWRSHQIMLRV